VDTLDSPSTGFPPGAQGLYDPANEHDACGVGFVANIKGKKSHEIIEQGLTILKNLTHRGAVGADPKASDGAGILIQMPDRFFREEMAKLGVKLQRVLPASTRLSAPLKMRGRCFWGGATCQSTTPIWANQSSK
jgi:hypothetical protein